MLKEIPREQLFITTKLWSEDMGKDESSKSINKCLKMMGLEYLDMVLIHAPCFGKNVETYRTMCEFVKAGKIKNAG